MCGVYFRRQVNRKRWGEIELEARLQDVLFSELFTSVSYWSVALLLAIVGAGLVYWRLTHPTFAEPVSDPFGVTTPPWLILPCRQLGLRHLSATRRGVQSEANVHGKCWRRPLALSRSWA